MKYEEICRRLMDCKKKCRVPSKRQLEETKLKGGVEIITTEPGYIGDLITIYSDGSVLYEFDNRSTVFSIIQFWKKRKVIDERTGYPREDYITDASNDSKALYEIPCWVYEFTEFAQERFDRNDYINQDKHGDYPWEVADSTDYIERLPADDYCADIINKMYVSHLLTYLNKDQLLIIRLRIWNGFTFEEIADIMNSFFIADGKNKRVSHVAVWKMYQRAIKKLQRQYDLEN